MRIKFGRSELVMDEKGMITDITFDRESVFPQGQPSSRWHWRETVSSIALSTWKTYVTAPYIYLKC